MKRSVLLTVLLILAAFAAAGCSSVDYLKDVSRSFEKLQTSYDDLAAARKASDNASWLETLNEMKRETETIRQLKPGTMTKKAAKEVAEKNEAIAKLVDALLQETNAEHPDERKIDGDLKLLNDELWDTRS